MRAVLTWAAICTLLLLAALFLKSLSHGTGSAVFTGMMFAATVGLAIKASRGSP